jgi:hypothetical protein
MDMSPHAHAELRALSWRMSMHALEYSLTISPLYGSPSWTIFYRSGRKTDCRLGACESSRASGTRDAHISHSSAQPGATCEMGCLADGPRGNMAKRSVLQTAAISCLACGYAAGCRNSLGIRRMIARQPRFRYGHGQVAVPRFASVACSQASNTWPGLLLMHQWIRGRCPGTPGPAVPIVPTPHV